MSTASHAHGGLRPHRGFMTRSSGCSVRWSGWSPSHPADPGARDGAAAAPARLVLILAATAAACWACFVLDHRMAPSVERPTSRSARGTEPVEA
jgi:hypothetical protein